MTLRYWAAVREAAGVAQESFPDGGTLAELLAAARARRPGDDRFARLLEVCAYLVDEAPVGLRPRAEVDLPTGAVVEALPPYAGG